jgi:hypothetical protein
MRSDLLFMEYIVCHFLLGWVCDRCEQSGQMVQVFYPEIHWHGSVVEMLYRVRCPCGGRGAVPVRLPILIFAYVVGRLELLYAFSRGRHRKSEMPVKPEKSDLFSSFLRDFERDVAGFSARMAPATSGSAEANHATRKLGQPADYERFDFSLSEDEWVDFLRRMGFDDETQERSGE